MRASEFYFVCIKRAFSGRLAVAEFVSGVLSAFMFPVGIWVEPAVPYLNWIPFVVFIAVFLGTVIYGFARAPVDLYTAAYAEIGRLERTIFDREKFQKALNELWRLRAAGVEIRNRAIDMDNYSTWYPAWKAEYERWHDEVCTEARNISENLEQWLRTLDQVTQGTVVPFPTGTGEVLNLLENRLGCTVA